MTPRLKTDGVADSAFANPKMPGYGAGGFAGSMALPNLANLFGGKFSVGVSLPARRAASTLGNHIAHIVGLRSEEQVPGVDASGRVASVQNIKRSVEVAKCVKVGSAVSEPNLGFWMIEDSVTCGVVGCAPKPTPAIWIRLNLFVKSFRSRLNHAHTVSLLRAV